MLLYAPLNRFDQETRPLGTAAIEQDDEQYGASRQELDTVYHTLPEYVQKPQLPREHELPASLPERLEASLLESGLTPLNQKNALKVEQGILTGNFSEAGSALLAINELRSMGDTNAAEKIEKQIIKDLDKAGLRAKFFPNGALETFSDQGGKVFHLQPGADEMRWSPTFGPIS